MISIIITSYSLQRLQDAKDILRSIDRQTAKNFEVVYVTERDRRLLDAVRDEASKYNFKITVVHNEAKYGLAEARNLGVSESSGEIVAFVDDDVVLSEGWVESIKRAFESFPQAVGITGPAYPLWMGEKAEWLPIELDWLIGCTRWFSSKTACEVPNCWGMNMAFLKSALLSVGGFSEQATERSRYLGSNISATLDDFKHGKMAEDLELSLRLREKTRLRILYIPEMLVWNKVYPYRLTNRYIIARSSWIGYSRRNLRKMLPSGKSVGLNLEENLLQRLLVKLILPVNSEGFSLGDLKKRFRISLLSLFSLVVGYLIGPISQ
ncbi:MAG: glycosyltransferase [Conexivisphaerales archaeon]